MYPVLFQVGGVAIYSHGFFMLLGVLVGLALLILEARRRHWPKEEVVPIALAAFVGGMMGARLSILFFNGWETAPIVLNFYALFDPRIGPGSILGAVAGGYIGGYIAAKIIGKDGCACDAFAPAMAMATAIGRMGDFMAAEDGMGKATTLPWGVQAPGVDYLVHPAPLYDMAFNLAWFAVLDAAARPPADAERKPAEVRAGWVRRGTLPDRVHSQQPGACIGPDGATVRLRAAAGCGDLLFCAQPAHCIPGRDRLSAGHDDA